MERASSKSVVNASAAKARTTERQQRTIRVLIADDHAMFRAGLRKLLEAEPDMQVLGEAENGERAIVLTHQLQPDVLLLDLAMPGMSGLDALRELSRPDVRTRTVILTASVEPSQIHELVRSGAAGVLAKTAATELLYKCVRAVAAGDYWVGRDQISTLVEALTEAQTQRQSPRRPAGLTPRELDVIRLLCQGFSNKEIAARLSISEDTVKHHFTNSFDKTGTSSRTELAMFAQRRRLG